MGAGNYFDDRRGLKPDKIYTGAPGELDNEENEFDEWIDFNFANPHKNAFLNAFVACGTITKACKHARVSRPTHYKWLKDDPDYADAFAHAEEMAADTLEQEAWRRATGYTEPIFFRGEPVGEVKKYSDVLLMFLLRGARPDKYKDRAGAEISGKNGPIEIELKWGDEITSIDHDDPAALPDGQSDQE